MQGSISLRAGAQTRFMGQAEPWLGRAVTQSKDQSGAFSDMQWTEAWSCPQLPSQDRQQRGCWPEHGALWRISSKLRAMAEESTLPSITSTGVTSKHCPCCSVCVADGVSCTLSQTLEVPGRDNTAESELVTKGTMLAGTGVKKFCGKLAAETPTVKVCIIFWERWDLISLRTKLIEHLVNYWGN